MKDDKPLIDSELQLQKFPGKGGWTYAEIPGILQNKEKPFGWVKVQGSIDGFDLGHYHLDPMGNGKLFLPVKKAIRKVIRKEAGDTVRVILFDDQIPEEIPEEFMLCLKDDPDALRNFQSLDENEKQRHVRWIYNAKNQDILVERMAEVLRNLSIGNKIAH